MSGSFVFATRMHFRTQRHKKRILRDNEKPSVFKSIIFKLAPILTTIMERLEDEGGERQEYSKLQIFTDDKLHKIGAGYKYFP